MPGWERELALLRDGHADERAMVLRWFRRRPRTRDRSPDSGYDWVGLYELDAVVGSPATIVFPVAPGIGPGQLDQESFVLVRGATEPGRAVIVITSLGELEPAAKPRRPIRADPVLVGEL
jgi:hypothetical protein